MIEIEQALRVLELEPGSSIKEIRAAYKKLMKVWHPDRFVHDPDLYADAEEKTKRINWAYAILKSTNNTQTTKQPEDNINSAQQARRAQHSNPTNRNPNKTNSKNKSPSTGHGFPKHSFMGYLLDPRLRSRSFLLFIGVVIGAFILMYVNDS